MRGARALSPGGLSSGLRSWQDSGAALEEAYEIDEIRPDLAVKRKDDRPLLTKHSHTPSISASRFFPFPSLEDEGDAPWPRRGSHSALLDDAGP